MLWFIVLAILLLTLTTTTVSVEAKKRLAKNVVAEWGDSVTTYCAPYRIDPVFVLAMICQESAGNPDAQNPADPSRGLMQITPPVFDLYNRVNGVNGLGLIRAGGFFEAEFVVVSWENAFNPDVSLTVGIWYLNEKLKELGDMQRAITAYNGSGPMAELHWERVKQYVEIIESEKLL